MPPVTIGEQELALLHYIAEHEPASVGDVASGFGEPRALARSAVLTMMERLHSKGYLKRQQHGGSIATARSPGRPR